MALLELLGYGTPQYGSSPPSAPAGPFFVQFGSVTTPFAGGLSPSFYFPAAFRNGVLALVLELAYGVPSQLEVTISGCTNEFFSMCGHDDSGPWDTGGSEVLVEWEAWGW